MFYLLPLNLARWGAPTAKLLPQAGREIPACIFMVRARWRNPLGRTLPELIVVLFPLILVQESSDPPHGVVLDSPELAYSVGRCERRIVPHSNDLISLMLKNFFHLDLLRLVQVQLRGQSLDLVVNAMPFVLPSRLALIATALP